jgi:hypothetical protein
MAAFTSTQAGDWSDPATWGGSGPPGDGDTASIGHVVTVDTNTTVGTSGPTGTTAVTVTAGGRVVVATGIQWTVRGDILTATANTAVVDVITLEAGATLEMDASQASTPASQTYVIRLGNAAGARARFKANGTSGARCTVRSNSGGGNARFTRTGATNSGFFDCSYCDFLRIGDASNPFADVDLTTSSANSRFAFSHCTFDACGSMSTNGGGTPGNACVISVDHCRWKNTAGSGPTFGTATSPTGTRNLTFCSFDKAVTFTNTHNYVIEDCVFTNSYSVSGSGTWASFKRNFVRHTAQAATQLTGEAVDCYVLEDHATSNPHFLQFGTSPASAAQVIDGCIFESTGTAGNGDCILIPSPSGARAFTVKRCIVLPNAAGGQSGTLVSALGNANVTLVVEHNTAYVSANNSGLVVGETYNAHAGMVSSFKSNIMWRSSLGTGWKMYRDAAGTNQDVCAPADADRNCGHNLNAGSDGKGYNAASGTAFSTAPGANDVDEDPDFVDPTRDLASWDAALGGPGTVANAVAEILKLGDTDWNPDYNVADLLTWVRAGFAPQNQNLIGAAHDGGTIGAVPGVVSGGSGPRFARTRSLLGTRSGSRQIG